MTEFEKALTLKNPRKLSETKSFLEFSNKQIILYFGKEKNFFKNFTEMYQFLLGKEKRRFIIYTNQFDLLLNIYYKIKKRYKLKLLKQGTKIYGFELFNFISYRSMKYKFGSDKFSAELAIKKIAEDNTCATKSFTGILCDKININAIKRDFEPVKGWLLSQMMTNTPKGAIIGCYCNKSFTKVHSYDGDSAYPSILLEGKLPYKFTLTTKIERGKEYYVRFKFKNLKAKYWYCLPLYITDEAIGKNIATSGHRIIAAEEYEFFNFYGEKWIIDQFYTYDSCEIDLPYEIEFKSLPEESRAAIKELYDEKIKAKGTIDYDGVKQIINRVFGLFITKIKSKYYKGEMPRDREIPYQIGLWLIYKQRLVISSLIIAVGIEHLVHCHTDGVKFDCNADEIIKKANTKRGEIYMNMGQWKIEEVYDRCYYFGNTLGKYQIGDEIGMKHGGISDDDITQFLIGKTYDEITENSVIYTTSRKELISNENETYIQKEYIFRNLGGIDNVK